MDSDICWRGWDGGSGNFGFLVVVTNDKYHRFYSWNTITTCKIIIEAKQLDPSETENSFWLNGIGKKMNSKSMLRRDGVEYILFAKKWTCE